MSLPLFGAIEAGGTKFNCAIATADAQILTRTRVDTTTPAATLAKVIAFFRQAQRDYAPIQALGLASFGPVELDVQASNFGGLLKTPKPDWSFAPIRRPLQQALNIPISVDTDVNAAALGEYLSGAAQKLNQFCYVTVGTGLGVGIMVNGTPLHGLIHPETGHLEVALLPGEPASTCPYHDNCLEGLICGPAIAKRWGKPAENFPPEDKVWTSQAYYLACLCHQLTLAYSPQRIILGGGVMQVPGLLDKVRDAFIHKLNHYLPVIERAGGLTSYICLPGLGNDAGLLGALELARLSLNDNQR